jgi:uncharacterized protein (TIRG00374 family)
MKSFALSDLRHLEILVLLSVVLFVGGAFLLSVIGDEGNVLDRLGSVSLTMAVGLLALSLLNYGARVLRWLLYSRRLGIAVPPGRNVLYFFAGFSLGTTPGKVGEAVRLWLLERIHGYRYARVVPLFLGDRLSDMNGVLLLCLLSVASFPNRLWLTALAAIAIVVLTLAFVMPRPLMWLAGAVHEATGKRRPRVFARVRTMLRHTARLFAADIYAATFALSMLGWSAEALGFHWLLASLGAPLPLAESVFIFTFSLAVGGASMLPGGLGTTEATMMGLLLAAGVEFDTALVATAVIRAATLWFGVALGFVALPFALRHVRRRGRTLAEVPR